MNLSSQNALTMTQGKGLKHLIRIIIYDWIESIIGNRKSTDLED